MNTPTNGGPAAQTEPQMNCLVQYIKDFSFENPNAPQSFASLQTQPSINIQINVNAQAMGDTDFEVTLNLEGKADAAGTVLYGFELSYAGVFRLVNIPQEMMQQIVMVDCPHLLFPFAREIIASAVNNSAFPPLLLGPVNFFGLYQQRMNELGSEQATGQPN